MTESPDGRCSFSSPQLSLTGRLRHLRLVGRWSWSLLAAGALLSACSSADEEPAPCSSSSFTEAYVNAGMDNQSLAGICMSRSLVPDAAGQVDCVVLEGRQMDTCDCAQAGRRAVAPEYGPIADELLALPGDTNCVCEIEQLIGDELDACQIDTNEPLTANGMPVSGWCVIDATTVPPTGNPELTMACPEVDRRFMRMVGEPFQEPSAILVACQDSSHCADG